MQIAGGMSCRQAAARFGVSASSAIRWRALARARGDAKPKVLGGDRRSGRIEAHAALILAGTDPAAGRGDPGHHARGTEVPARLSWRWGRHRHAVAFLRASADHAEKKTAHAAEQDRPDVLKRRAAWFAGRRDLDPARLVFIDETWASTNMARKRGRERKGNRLRVGIPYGHWKTTTFVAGLRVTGMITPMVVASENSIRRGSGHDRIRT